MEINSGIFSIKTSFIRKLKKTIIDKRVMLCYNYYIIKKIKEKKIWIESKL